jgi:hypothetical protein
MSMSISVSGPSEWLLRALRFLRPRRESSTDVSTQQSFAGVQFIHGREKQQTHMHHAV